MAKSFEMNGDISTDTSDYVCDNMKDFRSDLASNDGVNLNIVENETADTNVKEPISKSGSRLFAGFNAVIAGASGIGGVSPPETYGENILPPVTEIRQEYDLPNTQISQVLEQYEQNGDVPSLPFNLNGEEDDGRFDPNKPREAEELNTAFNEIVPTGNCMPSEQLDNTKIEDDLNKGE